MKMFDGVDDDLEDLQFDFDEDDDLLLAGVTEKVSDTACDKDGLFPGPSETEVEDLANISLGIENVAVTTTQTCDVSGFDRSAGQLWIYPTNYPVRDYQYNIVQQALHRNTLVVLPTGLGKTFIAAVVMYNMYRWFPQGKVVFMAPTKPLVAQQIHACYTIVGIPKEDTIEMTGNMNPIERERMWRQKRVIFLTPQVMTNDLSRGSFSATNIKCLVVDEAHKAVGNHAYCQVVQGLLNFSNEFRVLALSATPGSDLKGVQKVMCNLLIAHIELRSEESIDIRPYTHERKVDKIVVPMGEELSGVKVKYIQIMEMVVSRLIKQRVLYNREVTKLSKFLILKARDEYRQNPPSHVQGPQFGTIEGDFATAMSLYHGFELLQLHGLRSLYNFLLGIQSGDKGYGRTRYELCRNSSFIEIMEQLQEKFALKKLNGQGQDKDAKMAVGHPKMQRLEEIVVEHFKSFQQKNMDTRVMIFSQYRDSVEEIRNILNQHQPLVKAMAFIGQSSVGKSTKGYTQKEQLEVMRQFREGGYNTLVSTCVGEEGLDIGDVDLIVCFDAHKSPIRLVQRMGRTGRKRTGRIVMLVTQGKEEQIYNQSLYSKKSIHKAIANGAKSLHFYPHNPCLIPPGIKPKCHKMHITVKQPEAVDKKSKKSSSTANKGKPQSNGNDISTAFSKARSKQASSELSNAEYEEIRKEFCQISKITRHLPEPQCAILSRNRELEDQSNGRTMMDLSEWTPWQNRLQRAHLIGHSSTTRNLVETCEFIELQQSIGEDANSYGLEMRLYLNKADIVKSKSSLNQSIFNASGQSTIKSFFSLSQSMKQTDQSSRTNIDEVDAGISVNKVTGSGKGGVKKGKKKVKKDKNAKSSKANESTSEPSTSSTSGLFTTIRPVSEKKHGEMDIEIIEDEESSEMNIDSMPLPDISNAIMPTRKRKSNKKKLLNQKDALWKDPANGESANRTSKKMKKVFNISNSNNPIQVCGQNGELEMDFHGDLLHCDKSEKDGSCNKPFANITNGNQNSFNSSSAKRISGYKKDDVIEIEDSEEQFRGEDEQNCDINREEYHISCMIPSPPRIQEVAEIFGASNSPIDFASLDVYQLVDGWKKTSPEFLNFSANDLMPTHASDKNVIDKYKIFKTSIHESFNSEMEKMKETKSLSQKKKSNFTLFNESTDDTKLSKKSRLSFPILRDSENNVRNTQINDNEICHAEMDDVNDVTFPDNCNKPMSKADEVPTLNQTNKSLVSTQVVKESQLYEVNSSKPELSVDVDHQKNAQKAESCRTSPRGFVDSVDDVIGALDFDDRLFSPPPSVKKKAIQGKLGNTSLRNLSTSNISLATFSQALDCLHSSSSDSLQSPTNSLSTSHITDHLHTEKFTNLKSLQNSASSKEKESLQCGNITPLPIFENYNSGRTSREIKLNQENKQELESSPDKLVDSNEFDAFASDDELFTSDIIPPTPPKNNSGRSTITVGNSSQNNQSTFIGFSKTRITNTADRKEEFSNKELSENVVTESNNWPQDPSTPVAKKSNTLLSEEITNVQSTKGLSQNDSWNDENYSLPLECGDIVDDEIQNNEDNGDCIIVTPPTDPQKLPLISHQDTECIEIFDSQSHQSVDHFSAVSPSEHLSQRNQETRIPTFCNTPTTSRSGAKSFLSTSKKKRLSLKSAGSNSFEFECHKTPAKDKIVSGKTKMNVSLFRNIEGQMSASTPVAKGVLTSVTKGQRVDDDGKLDDVDDIDVMLEMDHLTPIKGLSLKSTLQNEDDDDEKSFIIKRKRKPAAALDCSSDSDSSPSKKNSWLSAKRTSDENQSKDSKKDKSKSFEEWQASCLDGMEDEDDFEQMEHDFSKGKKTKTSTHLIKAERKAKSGKRLKRKAGFVENEADVSGDDASSDEDEGAEDDCYEGSFINNDTMMTQTQADGTDMRAVYLKSVKSPVHGKYRLQFNHAHNTDIFSQAVTESQGMSEYEEDSFCVGSDEEDSDSPVKEVKKKKQKDKRDKDRKKGKSNNKKRRVVCEISGSSSEDDENGFPFTQEVTTNHGAIVQKALMSSSEDEKMDQKKEEESDNTRTKIGRKTTHVLDDTNDYLNRSLKNKASSSIQGFEQSENQTPHRKNRCALVNNSGVNKDEDILHIDEWMDDFDATDMDRDPIPQKWKEKLQASDCNEGSESAETMPNALDIGVEGIHVSHMDIRKPLGSSRNSSLDHSIQSEMNTRASNTIAYVKPLSRSNESSSMIENNADSSSYTKDNIIKTTVLNRDVSREERLKRQKEKQERFRQKLAQVQQQQQPNFERSSITKIEDESPATRPFAHPFPVTSSTLTPTSSSSMHQLPSSSRESITYSSPSNSVTHLESPAIPSNISANTSSIAGTEALQILVDTREISGAQDVISALRLKHSVTVTAKQLASCDYVLSNHLVVDRTYWSAFSNGANRSRLVSRLCEMQSLYRKCAIIIEADKVKAGQEKSRKHSLPHSKYVDRTMACLIQTGVKMYFTDSADQTASLLSDLCQAERRKGRHLTVPTKLNPKKEGMFNFVMSIPQINVIEALNLVHKYSNLIEIVTSPAAMLQKRGCFSSEKVQWLYSYFRHRFDPQMLPTSYR